MKRIMMFLILMTVSIINVNAVEITTTAINRVGNIERELEVYDKALPLTHLCWDGTYAGDEMHCPPRKIELEEKAIYTHPVLCPDGSIPLGHLNDCPTDYDTSGAELYDKSLPLTHLCWDGTYAGDEMHCPPRKIELEEKVNFCSDCLSNDTQPVTFEAEAQKLVKQIKESLKEKVNKKFKGVSNEKLIVLSKMIKEKIKSLEINKKYSEEKIKKMTAMYTALAELIDEQIGENNTEEKGTVTFVAPEVVAIEEPAVKEYPCNDPENPGIGCDGEEETKIDTIRRCEDGTTVFNGDPCPHVFVKLVTNSTCLDCGEDVETKIQKLSKKIKESIKEKVNKKFKGIPNEKLIVLSKIIKEKIKSFETNKKYSQEKKEKMIAAYMALGELIDEKLN